MKNLLRALAALLIGVSAGAYAQSWDKLTTVETITLKASPDTAWAVVKDYDSLHKWHPAFADDVIVAGVNNQMAAVRKLTIKDGPSFTEELLGWSDYGKTYTYRILESPLPLKDYSSTLTVTAAVGGGSVITWSGTFKRPDKLAKPDQDDAATMKFISGVYQAGLQNVKKMVDN